jgi:hypothetical protein
VDVTETVTITKVLVAERKIFLAEVGQIQCHTTWSTKTAPSASVPGTIRLRPGFYLYVGSAFG